MDRLTLMLGWRLLKGARHEQSISIMIKISFVGIAIGVFALALVVSIMSGFEKITHETMQSIHPQLFVRSDGLAMNVPKLAAVFQKEFPEIVAYAPNDTQHVLLENNATKVIDTVVIMRGIDPNKEEQVSSLHTKLIKTLDGKKFNKLLTNNHIIIGDKLADNLGLNIGNTITLFYAHPRSQKRRTVAFDDTQAIIVGIFKTGIDEFDANLIVSSLEFLQELFPDSKPTEIGITLAPNVSEENLIRDLSSRTGLDVLSWKQLYPALVAALHLEKYVMFFLLALVTLVASMNIISLMFMQIIRKQRDIALLQALGLEPKKLALVFYTMGFLLTTMASFVGLSLAYIVGLLLKWYPFIKLPDVYYVTQLPVHLSLIVFVSIFILALIFSFIALAIPIRTLKRINIAYTLRFES